MKPIQHAALYFTVAAVMFGYGYVQQEAVALIGAIALGAVGLYWISQVWRLRGVAVG